MAKPHGKSLLGREGGKKTAHWYDFIRPKRRLLENGARAKCKPGVGYVIAVSLVEGGNPIKHYPFRYERCKCTACVQKFSVWRGLEW